MKTVAVVFGGRSVEHDISIITGQFIIAALKAAEFNVVPIYIAKDGAWHSDPELADLKFFQRPDFGQHLGRLRLPEKRLDGQFSLVSRGLGREKTTKIDVVFPALHGTYG